MPPIQRAFWQMPRRASPGKWPRLDTRDRLPGTAGIRRNMVLSANARSQAKLIILGHDAAAKWSAMILGCKTGIASRAMAQPTPADGDRGSDRLANDQFPCRGLSANSSQ